MSQKQQFQDQSLFRCGENMLKKNGRLEYSNKFPTLEYPHKKVDNKSLMNPELNYDTLKNFQNQLANKNKLDLWNKKKKNGVIKKKRKIELDELNDQYKSLRYQAEIPKSQNNFQSKVQRLITDYSKSIEQERKLKLPMVNPQKRFISQPNIPLYMQFVPYSPHPCYCHTFKDQSSSQEDLKKRKSKKKKNTHKYVSNDEKERRKIRLQRIMKKCFRAVAYTIYLKNLAKKIRLKKKQVFNKFWPQNFQKFNTTMRKWFSSSCKKFFNAMIANKDVTLNIEGDENEKELEEKVKILKGLIGILVQCLDNLTDISSFEELFQIVQLFCKHGSYVENGVITQEQAETISISDVHGYLRLDKSLQKSQLINFLFMKIILYNMLLQPWKYNSKLIIQENHQNYENFYFISSIFYQIMSDVQNDYLKQDRSALYPLGNWVSEKGNFKIKFCPSLVHLQQNYQKGEIISGLVAEKTLDTFFPQGTFHKQMCTINSVLNKMHMKLREAHWKLINSIYPYKNMRNLK